jgi:hypothetical protein
MTSIDVVSIFLAFLILILFWHVSQKIKYIEKMGIDIPVFLKGMNDILDKVTQNIAVLQNHARATHKNMNEKIPLIQEKTDDLSLLIERTERSIQSLESLIEKAKDIERNLNLEEKTLSFAHKKGDRFNKEDDEEEDEDEIFSQHLKNKAFSFMKRK